jgi:uncharacterized phage infection (PIP) family protein YhgE
MQIPSELLKESNYSGTRLIEIKDAQVTKLQKELTKLQLEANPFLEEMEKLTPILDPYYTKLRNLQEEIKKVQEEMAPTKETYDEWLEKVQKIDQKAQLIKNKIQPIVLDLVNPQLTEFEKANQMIEKDGQLFVEVADEIEEKVKAIRASKVK